MNGVFGPCYELEGVEILLTAGKPLRLTRARGQRVRCTGGFAWVTAPGVPQDIVLRAGDAWDITSGGLVLVEAIGRATVALGSRPRRRPNIGALLRGRSR